MDFKQIGPEAFADKELTVINYRGDNFYRACGVIVKVTRYGTTSCVKRVDHPGEMHEDYDGNTKADVNRGFFTENHEATCAICTNVIGATETKFKCCPRHTPDSQVVCSECNKTAEHGL